MLHKIGTIYADIWYSLDGYRVSIVPAEKMITVPPDSFFEMVYDEGDVTANLGPYPDVYRALSDVNAKFGTERDE